MDPTTCLERILTAIVDNDRSETLDALADLHEWIRKRGFFPKVEDACKTFLDKMENRRMTV